MQDSLSTPSTIPRRLRRDKRFSPCAIGDHHELFANGIFEFNITRILEFVDADSVRYPVDPITVSSIPDLGGGRLHETTVRSADLNRPVLLAEISPERFNLIDGHHRIAKARREGLLSMPARRIRCPDHLAFLTSARAYECYVKYWNGKVKEMEPRRRRGSVPYDRRDDNLRDTP